MTDNTLNPEQLKSAQAELAKLPLLGPALWLMARDAQRRFTFVADIDWRLLPPLVLDQCKLLTKQQIPWAFCSWALVSEPVDERLRTAGPVIAPHEWRSGSIPWLIDVIAPFGEAQALAQQVKREAGLQGPAHAWIHNAQGQPELVELP